tara:strand:- start:27343 stop:28407 length:1065 start_codon:yes stop_codon:yes gene_type:complete
MAQPKAKTKSAKRAKPAGNAKKAVKKAPVKKAAAKKPAAKKAVVSKSTSKKPTVKKAIAKKSPASKKPLAKKAAAKKAPQKKAAPVKKQAAPKPKKAPAKTPEVKKTKVSVKSAVKAVKKAVAKKVAEVRKGKAAPKKVAAKPEAKAPVKATPKATPKAKKASAPAPAKAAAASKTTKVVVAKPRGNIGTTRPPKGDIEIEQLAGRLRAGHNDGSHSGPIPTEAQIRSAPDGQYMNDGQLAFFQARLMQMRGEVLARELDVKERLHQREIFADPADRASAEEEHWLDLRLRERESLLLKKIDEALRRIRDKEYGYCEKTGEAIGIARLLARPTATVCVDVKGQDERAESQYRDR